MADRARPVANSTGNSVLYYFYCLIAIYPLLDLIEDLTDSRPQHIRAADHKAAYEEPNNQSGQQNCSGGLTVESTFSLQ